MTSASVCNATKSSTGKLHDTDKQNGTGKYIKRQQNYPGSVPSYDTRRGNEMGIFCNAPRANRGLLCKEQISGVQEKFIQLQKYKSIV